VCRAPITSVVNADTVKQHFDELRVHCRYGCKKDHDDWVVDPEGCPVSFPFKDRQQHEQECDRRTVSCPRGGAQHCPTMQARQVARHLQTCVYAFVTLTRQLVEVHVGGRKFTTSKHSLTSVPSRFTQAVELYQRLGYLKFDRDPTHFQVCE
jgi:hypothetical protein